MDCLLLQALLFGLTDTGGQKLLIPHAFISMLLAVSAFGSLKGRCLKAGLQCKGVHACQGPGSGVCHGANTRPPRSLHHGGSRADTAPCLVWTAFNALFICTFAHQEASSAVTTRMLMDLADAHTSCRLFSQSSCTRHHIACNWQQQCTQSPLCAGRWTMMSRSR